MPLGLLWSRQRNDGRKRSTQALALDNPMDGRFLSLGKRFRRCGEICPAGRTFQDLRRFLLGLHSPEYRESPRNRLDTTVSRAIREVELSAASDIPANPEPDAEPITAP